MKPKDEWRKKVIRVLKDPDGREALKEFGIEVDLVHDGANPQKEEKPIVAILCPTYRAPEPQMTDALSAMVAHTRKSEAATVYGGAPIQASVVHWSRNRLITEQLLSGKPWTHVLFIDDDIVVQPDALCRLLSHQKDIVAGLCTRRQDPPIPNMLIRNDKGKYDRIWEWPENSLIGASKNIAIGTGLMLISKHALEQVGQVWLDCLWEQEYWGLSGEKLERIKKLRLQAFDDEKICYWFRFLGEVVEMGEDITFCDVATKYCDLGVYVDTAVQPGHIGNYAYSIRDFMPYRDECVQRAKDAGKYRTQEQNLGEVKQDPQHSFFLTHEKPELVTA